MKPTLPENRVRSRPLLAQSVPSQNLLAVWFLLITNFFALSNASPQIIWEYHLFSLVHSNVTSPLTSPDTRWLNWSSSFLLHFCHKYHSNKILTRPSFTTDPSSRCAASSQSSRSPHLSHFSRSLHRPQSSNRLYQHSFSRLSYQQQSSGSLSQLRSTCLSCRKTTLLSAPSCTQRTIQKFGVPKLLQFNQIVFILIWFSVPDDAQHHQHTARRAIWLYHEVVASIIAVELVPSPVTNHSLRCLHFRFLSLHTINALLNFNLGFEHDIS